MALLEALQTAATGAAKAKVSGRSRDAVELAQNLYNRANMTTGAFTNPAKPGKFNHLQAARGRPDPLLNVDWYCQLPTLQGVAETGTTLGWEMVEEASLPILEFEPQSNYRAGKMYHYPGHQNLGSLTLKLYESVRGTSTLYLRNWQALIFDRESGLYNVPAAFKFPITVTLIDCSKLEVLVFEYTGCFPQSVEAYALASGAAAPVAPSVTFSVDDVLVKVIQLAAEDASSLANNIGKEFPSTLSSIPSVFPTRITSVLGI